MLLARRPEEGGRAGNRHPSVAEAGVEAALQRKNDACLRVVVRTHAASREADAAAESEATRMPAGL